MSKPRIIKARNFTLSIEKANGEMVPIGPSCAPPPSIMPQGDVELEFDVHLDWVNRWKLLAYVTPPL